MEFWSFGNHFARNVAIFGVDNSALSHTNNWKNNFLESSERPTDGPNDSISAAARFFSDDFSKVKKKKFTLHWWWELLVCK